MVEALSRAERPRLEADCIALTAIDPASLRLLSTTDTKTVVRLLSLMADEADEWLDKISDGYRPLMCEPRTNWANNGARSKLSLGDLRRARAIYVKLAR